MGFEAHSPKVLCAHCKRMTPRMTTQDAVTPDGLRRRPLCLGCRTELNKKEMMRQNPTAERQE